MSYVRMKDGIYKVILVSPLGFVRIDKREGTYPDVFEKDIIKQADTIEELYGCLVVRNRTNNRKLIYSKNDFRKRVKRNKTKIGGKDSYEDRLKYLLEYNDVYCAIWTGKGLIYVAKMNEEGKLELL